jgi:hypothetical protein
VERQSENIPPQYVTIVHPTIADDIVHINATYRGVTFRSFIPRRPPPASVLLNLFNTTADNRTVVFSLGSIFLSCLYVVQRYSQNICFVFSNIRLVSMCITEHVHHSCGHWGQERFIGEPCIRSRKVADQHMGCAYKEIIGMANSSEPCFNCKKYLLSSFTNFDPPLRPKPSWSNTPRSSFSSGQTQTPAAKHRRLSWTSLQGELFLIEII